MIKTWDELEIPILRALADMEDAGAPEISQQDVAQAVGLPLPRVHLGLRRLVRAEYLSAEEYRSGAGGPAQYLKIELLERGLRAAGAWPTA